MDLKHLTLITIPFLILFLRPGCEAQELHTDFSTTIQRLYTAKTTAGKDEIWNALVSSRRVPLVSGDSVAFLYRGPARTVAWIGDFNGWGQSKSSGGAATRIPDTDIWILKATLPPDARIDYKILINKEEQILDPNNRSNQWSGVGGGSLNSELRMPEWREDSVTSRLTTGAPRGHIDKDLLFASRELGYQVTYSVYTPPTDRAGVYPVIYVTDGYEYMHERMGNMPTILDNLIHAKRIEPVVVVFIDHRQPVNRSNNRRMQELAMNEKFSGFIRRELIPRVETNAAERGAVRRAIIGASMGGLTATWLSFQHPDVFGRAAAQSPAFWFNPEIYALCEKSAKTPERIFLSTGRIHDVEEATLRMRGIFDRISCPYAYTVVNQGQSWGNWRDQIDDMLIYLFPAKTAE